MMGQDRRKVTRPKQAASPRSLDYYQHHVALIKAECERVKATDAVTMCDALLKKMQGAETR